jgi:HD-GYP domain-containing protein (c-di-GMP phosphodiesterase class II)
MVDIHGFHQGEEVRALSEASLSRRLEQLHSVGKALSRERDIRRLLETILIAAKDITHADGGTLYLMSDDRQSLRFEILRTDSLGTASGGSTGVPVNLPDLPLRDEAGRPNESMVAVYAAMRDQTVNIADAYSAAGFDFSGTRRFDARTGYRSTSFLTVPMKDHDDSVIGVLQLINAIDPVTRVVTPFNDDDQVLVESLASQAAIALNNRLLISQQEGLFESFISLINLAIDEKSPYTGGHCQRVPELTMMLAEAVSQTRTGPLAAFQMTEKDRYELKIAGLLHDCGKITTPVHVVDKATKLEAIFDRIELLKTRFLVIRRDFELAALRDAQQAGGGEVARGLAQQLAELDTDLAFLVGCNRGGESMSLADQDRVRAIAVKYVWTNLDGQWVPCLTDNEIENLTIRAGTLTASERLIINNHITATIRMLEQLPWPRHLKNVPEYAGGHHERMDGKGYPRGLTRDQMSVQARVMAIADIFEALTAKDRPYKPGMKLSQAMEIMAKFSSNGHIDPDLFEVFIEQRVHERYAAEFLAPFQRDAVDLAHIRQTAGLPPA